eukprot:NODE_64_length_24072_cov_0.332541.p7 type:complete len:298 gc:universal NODE_64_length_24072_cov_0.332541:22949-23842(+)
MKTVQLYYATWSKPSMNLLKVVDIWKKKYENISFECIDVDDEDIDVAGVPTLKMTDAKQTKEYVGANAHLITKMLDQLDLSEDSIPTNKDEPYNEAVLKELVNSAPIMIFIKGTPAQPKCKFTRELLDIFININVRFSYFNILSNEYVRLHMKEYAQWPTFPQVWLHSEFIGGLEIIKELRESNELLSLLKEHISETTEDKCNRLINQTKVMIFIKGSPTEPQCGFSRTLVNLLNSNNIDFGYFDILKDENVRQTLKNIQDWPTYPMLFVRGELMGGLDIVKEMLDGELQDIIRQEV